MLLLVLPSAVVASVRAVAARLRPRSAITALLLRECKGMQRRAHVDSSACERIAVRSRSMRGTLGHSTADLLCVVRTPRWRLCGSGIHLTSAATAQQ